MIKSIEFKNFRNLNGKYNFNTNLNIIIGKNNSGKTNILEGIKLAFSCITNDYFKISETDFKDSDDTKLIEINVELDYNSIPTLNLLENKCGFKVKIRKTQNGRYVKEILLLDDGHIDMEILREDLKIPNLYLIPLIRIEDIFTTGLTTGISKFINSEEKYKDLKKDSKSQIQEELKDKKEKFQELCSKFNENIDIRLTEPKISDEKVFVVDGDYAHNINIGSGYKSIANIMLNTLDEKFNIILIDEIENHLHPSLIRILIRELRKVENTMIITTTHSSVVINEAEMEEIIDSSGKNIIDIEDKKIIKKLNVFLHTGRNELMLADNVILVEGYTEEILLKYYLKQYNINWTIINVAGVMFEPYIILSKFLNKNIVVISDNDKSSNENDEPTTRFNNLKKLCLKNGIKIIEMNNTLETDLYEGGFLINCNDLLKDKCKYEKTYKVAKDNKKVEIAEQLIMNKVDLDEWHVIKEIKDECGSN